MKTSGYNFQDIEKQNKDIDSIFNIEGEKDMRDELQFGKKKKKFNFDRLFPAPKDNENMGMDDLYDGEPFKGLI